jgi:hypothetical protein
VERKFAHRNLILLVALVTAPGAVAQTVSTFGSGLQSPIRLLFTPQGSLLVSEGGPVPVIPNTGRVSILDRSANRRTLIDGLPSGPAAFCQRVWPDQHGVGWANPLPPDRGGGCHGRYTT